MHEVNEQKICMTAGTLKVPDRPVIPFIEGDGIGPDVWRASKRVIDAAVGKAYNDQRSIQWKEVLAGEKAFNQTGEWLPHATIDALKKYLVAIKGPLTTPVGGGIRSLNVALRQELDLFACVRPVRWYHGAPSPLKHPERVNMVIFRENTEDIYAGIEYMFDTAEAKKLLHFLEGELNVKNIRFPETSSLGIKPVSREGSERLIRAAIRYALDHQLPSVTLVHKGNIMKFTEGAFRTWGYELAKREFHDQVYTWMEWEAAKKNNGEDAANQEMKVSVAQNKVIIKDAIADNFLQQILLAPEEYSVIATLNLNGDYISDALAAAVGGIGIAPGANINYTTGYAIFEATHGTAPRFANTDSMNPSSLILSGRMMLEYMGWKEASDLIVKGLGMTIMRKTMTIDFYHQTEGARLVKCSEFGEEVVKNMTPPVTSLSED